MATTIVTQEFWRSLWGQPSTSLQVGLVPVLVSVIAVLVATDALYNLYFSPLAKFPGPRLCAISRIPHLVATIRGRQVPWLVGLHEKYGGIVRIAPDALTCTDDRGWANICGSTPAAKNGFAKDPRLAALVGGDLVNPDPAKPESVRTHAIMRRAMNPALKGDNVRKLEAMIAGHVDEYLAAISGPRVVNMSDANGFLVCNLITDLFLGESLNLFSSGEFRDWVHSFDRFARGVTILAVLNRFPLLHKVLLFAVQRWGTQERESFMQPILSRFDRRVANGKRRDDMMQLVLDGDGTGRQGTMPMDLLREFAPFLVLGGCEAMPTIFTGFVYYVFRRSSADARKRLLAEVRGAFASRESITMERISRSAKELPYFEACLAESTRLYSPAATGTDRVVPAGGAQVAGQWVPGGTIVMMLHQVTYLVTQNFTRPDEFIPERWLAVDAGRPAEFNDDKRQTVHPFSVGPQSCFGQELSFYVLRLTLCKLLYQYDLELAPECEDWDVGQVTYTTRVKPPLFASVTPAQH